MHIIYTDSIIDIHVVLVDWVNIRRDSIFYARSCYFSDYCLCIKFIILLLYLYSHIVIQLCSIKMVHVLLTIRPISQTVFMLSIAINRAEHLCATVIIKHIYMLICAIIRS